MSHINQINFLGFSNTETPPDLSFFGNRVATFNEAFYGQSDQLSAEAKSLLYPYLEIGNTSYSSTRSLKDFSLKVNAPKCFDESWYQNCYRTLDLDTKTLYHGFAGYGYGYNSTNFFRGFYEGFNLKEDPTKTDDEGKVIIIGNAPEGELGGVAKGLPVRFQKIHFLAHRPSIGGRDYENGDPADTLNDQTELEEYYAYIPISDPILVSGDSHKYAPNDIFYYRSSKDTISVLSESDGTAGLQTTWLPHYPWNNNEITNSALIADEASYSQRLIIGGDSRYEDIYRSYDYNGTDYEFTSTMTCDDREFDDMFAVCVRNQNQVNGQIHRAKYQVDLNEIVNMTLRKLINLLGVQQAGASQGANRARFIFGISEDNYAIRFHTVELDCRAHGEISCRSLDPYFNAIFTTSC